MQLKSNEATINRPAGNRPIDASNLLIDLNNYIDTIKAEHAWESNDKNGITLFKSPGVSIVLTGLHANAIIDDYNRGGITIAQVLTGKILFTSDGQQQEATQGQIVVTHRDDSYFIKAIEESFLLLTIKD